MPYLSRLDQVAAARRHYDQNKVKVKARARAHERKLTVARRLLIDAFKARPCFDCGREFPPVCMDFDHVRGKKRFNIGDANNKGVSLETLKAEIEKCDVVCACCHRIRTFVTGEL